MKCCVDLDSNGHWLTAGNLWCLVLMFCFPESQTCKSRNDLTNVQMRFYIPLFFDQLFIRGVLTETSTWLKVRSTDSVISVMFCSLVGIILCFSDLNLKNHKLTSLERQADIVKICSEFSTANSSSVDCPTHWDLNFTH